ncbi:MAG: type IV CRISPR-associated protein Csf1 [Bacteroidota bacterium]
MLAKSLRENLKLEVPQGVSLKKNVPCMFCGESIDVGIKWKPAKGSFNDWQNLENSNYLCLDCASLKEKKNMGNLQKTVINKDGAWKLGKAEYKMWFFLTPPKPPFVAMLSTAKSSHMFWKSAVTLDLNCINIMVGNKLLEIDRDLAFEAAEWCREVSELAKKKKQNPGVLYPFFNLSTDMKDTAYGTFTKGFLRFCTENKRADTIRKKLLMLGEGEIWALSTLIKQGRVKPVEEKII